MKMKYGNFLLLAISLLVGCSRTATNDSVAASLLSSCDVVAEHQVVNGDTVIECILSKVKQTITMPLSHFAKDFKLVKLDNTTKEMMISITNQVAISDNYIITYSYEGVSNVFDKKGKFLRNIGSVGNGPGEYHPYASYLQIDEPNNRVYLNGTWTPEDVICVYSLIDGQYVEKIPLCTKDLTCRFYVDKQKNIVKCTHIPMEGETDYIAWTQDLEGNLLHSVLAKPYQNENYYIEPWRPGYGRPYFILRNSSYVVRFYQYFTVKDSIYHYEEERDRLVPYFTVKYENNDKIPWNWMDELNDYYLLTIFGATSRQDVKSAPSRRILIDKNTLRGAEINLIIDEFGNYPVTDMEVQFTNDYFYYNIPPDELEERIESLLQSSTITEEQRRMLTSTLENITSNDNNYIMLARLK